MKILSDKEYKELNNQIEEYKSRCERILRDYYSLNEENINIKKLCNSFQSKNQKLRNKLEKLEEENKKLKEDYDLLDKFDDKNIDDYKKLEEELEKEKNAWKNMLDSRDKLVNRISKALQYLKDNYEYQEDICEECSKILKGEE